jgi:S1-C subfamily serine protease
VLKRERRALYGPDHPRVPYEASDALYRLRYHLVNRRGHWLVDSVSVLGVTPMNAGGAQLNTQQVAARVFPLVMHVEADAPDGQSVGTGIVVGSSATTSDILTNDHVVAGATTVKLQRWVAGGYVPARPWVAAKVWEDQRDDLAVVRIDEGNLPVASWADEGTLQPGQAVVAIGYAEDLAGGPTITEGIVSSALRTAPDAPDGPTYIGHSAPINHGNSGGPLTDMSGRIAGVNTWTLDGTQGLYFAIPATRAARVVAVFTGSNG